MPIIRDHPLIPGAQYLERLPSEPRFQASFGVTVSVTLDRDYVSGIGTGTETLIATIRARDIEEAAIAADKVTLSVVPTDPTVVLTPPVTFGTVTAATPAVQGSDYVFTSVVTVTKSASPALAAVTSLTVRAVVESATGRAGLGAGSFFLVTTRPNRVTTLTAESWIRGIRLRWETPATTYTGGALATNTPLAYYLIRKALTAPASQPSAPSAPSLTLSEAQTIISQADSATNTVPLADRAYAVTGNAFVDPELVSSTAAGNVVWYYYWLVAVDLFNNVSDLSNAVSAQTGFVLDTDIVAGSIDIARIAERNSAATAVAAGTVTATKVGVVNVAFDPALIKSHHRNIAGTLTEAASGNQYYQSIAWKGLWLVIGESPATKTYNPPDGDLIPAAVNGVGTVSVITTSGGNGQLTFSEPQDSVLGVGAFITVGANSYTLIGRSSSTVWIIAPGGAPVTNQAWSYVFGNHAVVWDKSAGPNGALVLLPRATYQTALGSGDVLLGFNLNGEFVPSMAGTVIRGDTIETGTILANKLDVDQLSAITADLGTITAGIILDSATAPQAVLRLSSTQARAIVQNQYGQPVMATPAVSGTVAISGATATFSVSQTDNLAFGDAILAGGKVFTLVASTAGTSWTVVPATETVAETAEWVSYRAAGRLIDMAASTSTPLLAGNPNPRFLSVTRKTETGRDDLIYITGSGDAKFTGALQATVFEAGAGELDPVVRELPSSQYPAMRVFANAYFGRRLYALELDVKTLRISSALFNGLKVSSSTPYNWPSAEGSPSSFASLGQYVQAPLTAPTIQVDRRPSTGTASVYARTYPITSTSATTLSTLDNSSPYPKNVAPVNGTYLVEVKPLVRAEAVLGLYDALPYTTTLTVIVQKRDGSTAPWTTVTTRSFTYPIGSLYVPTTSTTSGTTTQTGWTYNTEGPGHRLVNNNTEIELVPTTAAYGGSGKVSVNVNGTLTFTETQTLANGEWIRVLYPAGPTDIKVAVGGTGKVFSIPTAYATITNSNFQRFTYEAAFTVPITSYSQGAQPEVQLLVEGWADYETDWNPKVPGKITFGSLLYQIPTAYITFAYVASNDAITREDSVASLGGFLYLRPQAALPASGVAGELTMFSSDNGATASPRYHDGTSWKTLGSGGGTSGVASIANVTGAITLGDNLVMSGQQLTLQNVVTSTNVGSYAAPITHYHSIGDITNLSATLDTKVSTATAITAGTGLTGGGTLSASRTLALTGQALAFHALASNGLVARTTTDTVVARTLTASGTVITVTNGDGVAGNPTIGITTTNITSVGTLTSLAVTGAVTLSQALTAANGGTGLSSYTVGDLLYASGATTLAKLAGVTTGNVLLSGATAPSWGKVSLTTHVSGTLPIAQGGTNQTSYTTSGSGTRVILYDIESASFTAQPPGLAGRFLQTAGTTGDVTWATPPNFTASTAGYAPASGGGTTTFLRADGAWATPAVGSVSASSVTAGTFPGVSYSFANATLVTFGDEIRAYALSSAGPLTLSATGANALTLYTNSTERLTISSTGMFTLAGSRPMQFDPASGLLSIKGDAGGWATGLHFLGSAGTNRGGFGALGGADSLSYLWIGPAYNNNWLELSSDGTNSKVPLKQNGSQVLHAGNYTNYAPRSQEGSRYTTDFNSILSTGFFNAEGTPTNAPGNYGQLIAARGIDTGLQIYGGYNTDNLWFRGWYSSGAGFTAWRTVVHSGNVGSYALPIYGGTMTGVIGSVGFAGVGAGGDSGISGDYYKWGYQEAGAWTSPYPDLVLAYHTGMKFGANTGYGGMRFYADHPFLSPAELFSIGNGDNHVRVANNLYINGNLALHTENIGTYAIRTTGGTATGTITAPSFSGSGASLTSLNAGNISTGTLPLARGGTNQTTYTTSGSGDRVLVYDIASASFDVVPAGISGQFLRSSGTTGDVFWATPPNFTASTAGYAPASGGGTTTFLRADGTWASPVVSGTVSASSVTSGTFPGETYTFTDTVQAASFVATLGGTQDRIQIDATPVGTSSRYISIVSPSDGLSGSYTLTLANGNTTLVAGTMVPNSRTVSLTGTTNQVTVSGTTSQALSGNVAWTLSLPQNIHTGATPTFASILLGTDPGGTNLVRAASARITSLGVGRDASGTTGRIDATGDIVAASTSDLRLKTHIEPLTGALEAIDQLSAIRYQWKQDDASKAIHGYGEAPELGVIAQEVEQFFPELVQTRENGYKAVRYERLVPVLLAAIKELREEVRASKGGV